LSIAGLQLGKPRATKLPPLRPSKLLRGRGHFLHRLRKR